MNDPAPDRLVGDDNPPFGQQILDVAEAQREAIIEPDRALDDFRREAVASVTDFGHSGRLRARARTQQGAGCDKALRSANDNAVSDAPQRPPATSVPLREPSLQLDVAGPCCNKAARIVQIC